MTTSSERLANITQQPAGVYRIREVVAVNGDNTVDLAWGEDDDGVPVTVNAPCESGYHTRAVGDIVRVLIDGTGWSVVAKVSAAPL